MFGRGGHACEEGGGGEGGERGERGESEGRRRDGGEGEGGEGGRGERGGGEGRGGEERRGRGGEGGGRGKAKEGEENLFTKDGWSTRLTVSLSPRLGWAAPADQFVDTSCDPLLPKSYC